MDAYLYQKNMTINPGSDGVILSWQRCCRNNLIDNIIAPEATGFTAWTRIPPKSTPNSSAFFTDIPPVYVCVDAPLTFPQTAIDPDGDSLVYELFTPFLGASTDFNRPPSNGNYASPTFRNIRWRGQYNEVNQMGGSPKLSINSKTGILQVTPNRIGKFVIGYRVLEYRDGAIISETKRDYQLNVIQCEFDVIANYSIPNGVAVDGAYSFECQDTVCFINKSYSKTPETYKWDFGVLNSTTDTSSEINPCFVYPGNGNYTVKLIVQSSICKDEYEYEVRIRSKKSFELGPDLVFCDDFNQILDTKTPDALSVNWNTGQTESRIDVQDTGLYIATVSYGNCAYTDSIQLFLDKIPDFSIPEDSLFCDEVDIVVDVGVTDLFYKWSSGPNDTSRIVRIQKAGTYNVVVRNDYCFKADTIRLWQITKPSLNDAFYCNDFNHFVDMGIIEEAEYLWSNGAQGASTTFTQDGTQWVQVKQRHCVSRDSFDITNPIIQLELGDDKHFCDTLYAELDGGPDGISYKWNNGSTSRRFITTSPGIYRVEVEDSNGCTKVDSVILSLSQSPSLVLGDDTTICVNSPTKITAPSEYQYEWNNGSTEQSITVTQGGVYSVRIIDEYDCFAEDSVLVTVDADALPNELYVPNAFTPNGDNKNELFPYSERVKQPAYFIHIYTRWGEKIFDSQESEIGNWDGFYKDEKVPSEVFIYYMYYRGCDGFSRTRKGTVNALY
ncbi:gliding motility-associated C-terminal domain-containing protein [Bacteroidia bacterium]|nr:gliding motility-associated C-terminal domain-containing protein [Bacteroidia bacterium]MDB4107775.1 gliding motility-associated C-terminal domain-containing protein [Bacteroidia bacterium]